MLVFDGVKLDAYEISNEGAKKSANFDGLDSNLSFVHAFIPCAKNEDLVHVVGVCNNGTVYLWHANSALSLVSLTSKSKLPRSIQFVASTDDMTTMYWPNIKENMHEIKDIVADSFRARIIS